jgi:hypothetical protein
MLYFAGCLNTGWDLDPSSLKLSGSRYRTHHQRPPENPPSMSSSTSMVDAVGPTDSAPLGARHRHHLQNSVVDAARPAGSTPRGPTIDVFFNLGGGHYQTYQ